MIPEYDDNNITNANSTRQPSKTYRIDFEAGRISGFADGLEAVRQAVYKILNTERFEHIIYSHNYGREFKNLYGKQRHFVYAELERRIKEALLWDDRITSVNDFSFRNERDCVFVKFTVDSVFGSTELESVVN